MTETGIEEKILRLAGNNYPTDRQISRGDLMHDESYPYRLVLGGYPMFLLDRAKKAADEFAASYRDFNVGIAGAGFNSTTNELGMFGGANIKVDDTDLINIHAEDVLLKKLALKGYNILAAIAVVGPLQNDTQSGQQMNTLHPCGKCRIKFADSPLVSDKTLFFTATTDFRTVEMTDIAGLLNFHEADDSSSIDTFELGEDFEGWDEIVLPRMIERFVKANA